MTPGTRWVVRHWTREYDVRIDAGEPPSPDERRETQGALFVLLDAYARGEGGIAEQVEAIHHALFRQGISGASGRSLFGDRQAERVRRDLEGAAHAGRLVLAAPAPVVVSIPDDAAPPTPLEPEPAREEATTSFLARFVDEIGEAISGLRVVLTVDGTPRDLTTDGSGTVRFDGAHVSSASLRVANVQGLRDIVEPRWTKPRKGTVPAQDRTFKLPLLDDLDSVPLQGPDEHLIVILPPLGKLYAELFDRDGRVRHANRKYSIDGPATFSGTTDENGQLLHEEVPPGDYTLTLTLDFFEDSDDPVSEDYESPLVVLAPETGAPQQRMIGPAPHVVMARMRGLLFDTNKTFLLPTAMDALAQIREIYEQMDPSVLLVVGHTDTTGEPSVNNPLSLDRAKSVKAYLEDDVDTWLESYDASGKGKWGAREDRLMIAAMPDFSLRDPEEDLVEWFQRTRDLTVDGKAGPQTRKQLITEYMQRDGVTLADDAELDIDIQAHGCGESFPLAGTGFELDKKAADGQEDAFDRRVELFFFDTDFGVRPAPGAPDGPEYLEWRKRADENHDFVVEAVGHEATLVEVHDALFRTNSCVVLPEGETPSAADHTSISSVGIFAATLRFVEAHPGRKLLVAGHTDTTGAVDFNQTLSEERAKVALALLEGDRDAFVGLADKRHTVADYKQILSWCAKAFDDVDFDCDPGTIDDNASTGSGPLRRFQAAYNANKDAIGASDQADLAVDGAIGPQTWGAFFDVYELGLRNELGEDAAGLADLRQKLTFVDSENKALGFGEHHPIEQASRDNFRSQKNRRVELLFFEAGEEPDIALAKSDPDVSEIYLPGTYDQVPVDVGKSAKRFGKVDLRVSLDDQAPWTSESRLVVTNAAGETVLEDVLGDGQQAGTLVGFTYREVVENDTYRAVVQRDDDTFVLFDQNAAGAQPETL